MARRVKLNDEQIKSLRYQEQLIQEEIIQQDLI